MEKWSDCEAEPLYEHIRQNDFSSRKHRKQKDEDVSICECKFDASDPESACGESCLNFLTSTECTPGFCPCGVHCKNQRFQKGEYAKTRLYKTEGRGWGLLADEDIKGGQFIIEYCGEVISHKKARKRSHIYEKQGLTDAYIISLNSSESIDATKKGSLARFINHSCQPNCETRKWNVLGEIRVGIFARQDISAGTELTYNYNFKWYGGAKVRCLCGAVSCSGFLGAKSRGFQEDTYLWEADDSSIPPKSCNFPSFFKLKELPAPLHSTIVGDNLYNFNRQGSFHSTTISLCFHISRSTKMSETTKKTGMISTIDDNSHNSNRQYSFHSATTNRRYSISHCTKRPKRNKKTGTDACQSPQCAETKKLLPLYNVDEYWAGNLGISSDYDIIDYLKENLPQQVLHMFRNTGFGNFLEIPSLRISKQLIHSLIIRQISQKNNDRIYVNIGGEILYFGIEHFLLISGLKAVAEDGFQPSQTGIGTEFCEKYFGKRTDIKKADIEDLFKNDGKQTNNKFASEKDCLKMALVYFISFFLMGINPNVCIPSMYFDCVETGEYEKAAWGNLAFQATINGLKKNGRKRKHPASYHVEGCPLIYQLWFYEVCGACQGFICERNRNGGTDFSPRIYNWRTLISDFDKSNLESMIFNKNAKDLDLKEIEATGEEIERLSLQKYFPFRLDCGDVDGASKNDDSQSKSEETMLKAVASLRVQMQEGLDVINEKIDKASKRLDDLERCLNYCPMQEEEGVEELKKAIKKPRADC